MTTKEELAQYSEQLAAIYTDAVTTLETQPKKERGALIVFDMLGEDLKAAAYGTPEQWAQALYAIASRNRDFLTALVLAVGALQRDKAENDDREL